MAESLQEINKELVNLVRVSLRHPCCLLIGQVSMAKKFISPLQEDCPMEEVFSQLKCTTKGLAATEVTQRISIFGYNKLEEKKVSYSLLTMEVTALGSTITIPYLRHCDCRKARF